MQPDVKKRKPAKKKARPKKRGRKVSKPAQKAFVKETEKVNDDYDGYYDDILPADEGRQREGIDQSIVKRIAILISCLVVVIGICVALMYLL